MKMTYWKAGIFFLVGFLIQTSLLNLISIVGHTPNLLLCLVIVFSFLFEEDLFGLVYGAIFGLLYDMCMSTVVGPTAISLALVAVLILILREYANIENIINMLLTAALSVAVYSAVDWLLRKIAGSTVGFIYMVKTMPISWIYSMAVVTVLYLILIRKVETHRKDRYFR